MGVFEMKNTDARIVNSKKFLKQALITLLEEKKISEIKVVMLCERAEINRATFYSHYKNVYQLFNEIMEDYFDSVCSFIFKINDTNASQTKKEMFKDFISYVDSNSSLFMMIFENSNNFEFSSNQYKALQQKIYEKISVHSPDSRYGEYLTNFFIYSGGSILYTWAKNGKKESYEEISKILYTLVSKGSSPFIHH